MPRHDLLNQWLARQLPGESFQLTSASADASFRRYYRLSFPSGRDSLIVMDAPPEHEDCRPWLHVATLFEQTGVQVPKVFAADTKQGFILMSDLGDVTYLKALNEHNAAGLYADALGSLAAIQQLGRPGLPAYSRAKLWTEMQLFDQWYLARHKEFSLDHAQREALETVYARVIEHNLAEPQVVVHRDYHSRNLMHLGDNRGPGIIDFQDAVVGPLSYDLVSLFKDAYIRWDEEFVLDLLIRYWEAARKLSLPVRADFSDFLRDYDFMGVQRHLKVLGIFARLYHRDGKAAYLDDMPRVMAHLRQSCHRYRELRPLLRLLDRVEPEPVSFGYTF